MPKKQPPLVQLLLNVVFWDLPRQTRAQSNQLVVSPQPFLPTNREAWCAYWIAQGQPWRTEPEIDEKRQEYLAQRRCTQPDVEHGIYPFRNIKLSRADVEWLLTTHENGRGPIDWSDESQRERMGLDLRGADLREVDLRGLPLARMRGGITSQERAVTTRPQRNMASAHLEQTNFQHAHLEGSMLRLAHLEKANLEAAYLEGADCAGAHLEGAYLCRAYLDGVYLRRAFFDGSTFLDEVSLGNEQVGFVSLVDVSWNEINLATIHWSQMTMLGDEQRARRKRTDTGQLKNKATRLFEHETAVRANRQLGTVLQEQGLNEEAARFAYRAQVLQKSVFRLQMVQHGVRLKQRAQALGAWLFSWFLFLLAGYGHRLWRSFLAYLLVITGFTTIYYLLGISDRLPLSLVNALGLSMTSFHGRGFFPGVTQLNDTLTILTSIEAFVGLVLEVTLIATLTQRFFGK